jgi:hypothetical protein
MEADLVLRRPAIRTPLLLCEDSFSVQPGAGKDPERPTGHRPGDRSSSLSRSIAERVPFHGPERVWPPARCPELPMPGPSFEEETTRSPKEFQDPGPPIERHSLRPTKQRGRSRPSDRATLAQTDEDREQDRDQVTQRGVHDRQQDGRSVLLISLAWPPALAGACPRRDRGRCAGVKRGGTWRLQSTKPTKHRWRGGLSG